MKTKILRDEKGNFIGRYDDHGRIYTPAGKLSFGLKQQGAWANVVENKMHTQRRNAYLVEMVQEGVLEDFRKGDDWDWEAWDELKESHPRLHRELRKVVYNDLPERDDD